MKKTQIIPVLIGLFLGTTFLTTTPDLRAVDSTKESPGATAKTDRSGADSSSRETSGRKLPFHGKLASVDAKQNTITVLYSTGNKVFHVTSATEMMRDNKPATLESGVVGEPVSGAYIKNGEKMELTKLTFGKKDDKDATRTKSSGSASKSKSKMKGEGAE